MLLDAATLDLAPRASEVIAQLDGDPRFKLELPAAQVEIVLPPLHRPADAAAQLAAARRDLLAAAGDELRLAAAGLHPFAADQGPLNRGPRYDRTAAEFGEVARRQLVFALQIHVAVRGADRALAVYNALRSYLPDLAALAAHAPFHAGRDTGMASWRPVVSQMLPRQGVPPRLRSWDDYAHALHWVEDPGRWWWELRPHPVHGTLELRVPDAQATVADAAAIVAVAQALAVRLAERHDVGEPLRVHDTWRIEENAWSAGRHGVEGELRDLDTGEPAPARARLHALLDELEPVAERLGSAGELQDARRLVERNGAMALREASGGDPEAATRWLMERFTV
ncbi:Putative glutamate--cysteine ligase 2 [Capillimicrobium parvum]|uniref:Putative glutamate--cysteine ligase 2 n=2 Tax=Capillimicrobium parvum TaxID=2884022 RepID=A0A9E6XTG5_9ACTN|nr:Putative glutamate--cysteine ligase 2 [Capillimicrobium parvum]